MSLQKYVRQVSPRNESYIPPVDRVQNFLHESVSKLPQEKQIDVDSLVSAEDSTVATQIYEAAAVIVGMEGLKLTGQKMSTVMGNSEFSPTAKKWIENFLKTHPNKEALDAFLNWVVLIGGAVADVHDTVFKDFIHRTVDKEYKGKGKAPITFGIETAQKPNTADVVLITSGTRQDVFSSFKQISKFCNR